MHTVTRHQMLYKTLRDQILAGRFAVNEKLPSEKELSSKFKVSRITVMRALSDLQNDGYIWRKQGSGTFIKSPAQMSCRLGLLIPGLSHAVNASVFPLVQEQITKRAAKLGWQVLLGDAEIPDDNDPSGQKPVEVARRFVAHGVNAVAFFPFGITPRGSAYNLNVLSVFRSAKVPVVLVGADIVEYPDRSDYDVIALDDQHAGYLLGRHLVAQGVRRIAFIGSPNRSPSRNLRLAGVRSAFGKAKNTSLVEITLVQNGREAKEIVAAIENGSCEAVVAENDEFAAHTMRYLLAAGLRIPEQIKICGFDNAPITELLPVPLTSVAQPVEALALELVSAVRERIQNPPFPGRLIRLHGSLAVRKSTSSARS